MTCKFCGNVIEDNSDICFICGQKVEAAPVAEATADAFAPAAPVAPVAPVAPAAPVAPVAPVAPAAPVYAEAPAAPVAPAVADIKAQKKALKAAKKAAKASKDGKKGGISVFRAIIAAAVIGLTFAFKGIALITIIVGILYAIYTYRSYNKAIAAGDTATATKIVNSVVIGACFGMAIACVLLINQSFLAAPAADAAAMQ